MTAPLDERRKGARAAVDFFVQVEHEGRTVLFPATDISATGLYLLASDDHGAFDPGRPLTLEFTLPTGANVRASASIAYIDDRMGQRGLGLEFSALDSASLEDIERFVDASVGARQRLG